MGVKVREKPSGSGIYWIFINHQEEAEIKKDWCMDEKLANGVAEKIKAKLVLGELDIEKIEEPFSRIFKDYAELWLSLPHEDWKESTRESYEFNLVKHVYPVFGKTAY